MLLFFVNISINITILSNTLITRTSNIFFKFLQITSVSSNSVDTAIKRNIASIKSSFPHVVHYQKKKSISGQIRLFILEVPENPINYHI